jgi:two-component system KDP operon response regulator KdpE
MAERGVTILIIDDDDQIRRFLRASLTANGYLVIEAANAADGERRARADRPDLILLDLGLPDRDGIDVLKDLRAWTKVPVIILSARGEEASKVKALDLGADDYVTKPFGTGELLARLRTALRHRDTNPADSVWTSEDVRVDIAARVTTRGGTPVKLSRREWDVLRVLVLNAGRVVTHRQILETVWGPAQADYTQYLWVYIGHLRDKLEPDPAQPRYFQTEPGVGYRLVRAEEAT